MGYFLRARPSALAALIVAAIVGLLLPLAAPAQVLERNLPPERPHAAAPLVEPLAPDVDRDDRPLGVDLRALVVLGPDDPVPETQAVPGVQVRNGIRLDSPDERQRLRQFLGQPLSRRLIGRIEAFVVNRYRALGHPFVQVSTPAQEVTGGTLRVRVVEFRLGAVKLSGAAGGGRLVSAIRTRTGDTIDAGRLSEDLDWLNRDPRHPVSARFAPGQEPGTTDLALAVGPPRRWGVTMGYANAGSVETGLARWSLGLDGAAHVLVDTALSVQATGSSDFWVSDGAVLGKTEPRYGSLAGRLQAFVAPRQMVELTLDGVETHVPRQAFTIGQRTIEARLVWRGALSDLAGLPGVIEAGAERVHQVRVTDFGELEVARAGQDLVQFVAGWSGRSSDRRGSQELDISLHASPGGIGSGNRGATLAAFTQGRMLRADYGFVQITALRQTRLGRRISLQIRFSGQYAASALPDSQQFAPGGPGAVRGYRLDDGAWDRGVLLRNDLVLPEARLGAGEWSLAPRLSLDAGWGWSAGGGAAGRGARAQLASGGIGADLRGGNRMLASLGLALPMTGCGSTRAGLPRFEARVSVSY